LILETVERFHLIIIIIIVLIIIIIIIIIINTTEGTRHRGPDD